MIGVVVAALIAAASPLAYETPHGPVELVAVSDVVAVHGVKPEIVERLARLHPGVRLVSLPRGAWKFVGVKSPAKLTAALERAGGTILPAYRGVKHGEWYVATDRVRARFAARVSEAEVSKWAAPFGAVSARLVHGPTGVWELVARSPQQTVALALALHRSGRCAWAEPVLYYQVKPAWEPNDAYYQDGYLWHLANIGAAAAWDINKGSASVTIAILDDGVDTTHPDLASKVVAPRDTNDGDNNPNPNESSAAHGTGCAGLAAAVTNNTVGVAGVCANCKLMPLRIYDINGSSTFDADVDGFTWATDNGAAVLSNSWGPAEPVPWRYSQDTAIRYATENGRGGKGSLVLFAAGNESREFASDELAAHPLVMAIGATEESDARASYSNYGPSLDVMAPAGSVTTDLAGSEGYSTGDYMIGFGGTSAATPVAAGVAGLIFSVNTAFTWSQVRSTLIDTADEVGGVTYTGGFHSRYGHGRVNALRALQAASGGTVCQPTLENCSNGVDDDCDGLKDTADPACGPTSGMVCGAPTYQCATGNICVQEDQAGTSHRCYELCTSDATCTSPETCTEIDSSTSICMEGGGACPPCGPMPCNNDPVCLDDGSLVFCAPSCTVQTDCPLGFQCAGLQSGGSACYPLSYACSTSGPQQGAKCGTGDTCALGYTCLTGGTTDLCYKVCRTTADCASGLACQQTNVPGIGYCDCACDTNAACQTGCACDPNCGGATCACDTNPNACDIGCPCDARCAPCACDTSAACDRNCACDADCGAPQTCDCDTTSACDDGCQSCDPECLCACDVSTTCDEGCEACDPECKDDGGGGGGCQCSDVSGDGGPVALAALVLAAFTSWNRRRSRVSDLR